jgi:hypothetical protein
MTVGRKLGRALLCSAVVCALPYGAAQSESLDAASVAELKRLIATQQAQIAAQAEALKVLSAKVDSLSAAQLQAVAPTAAPASSNQGLVASGGDKVSAKIYAQVNRGVLAIDDGHGQDVFFVDNDASSTRIGFTGEVKATDDVSIGTKIEVQMESNSTASVSQTSDRGIGGTSFTERHLDLYVQSMQFGKLSVGQGSTASDGISEIDMSGTDLVGYSAVADMAGGVLFSTSTGPLSAITVGSVFSNMDGLSRDDRVRYDTPNFAGFSLSGSLVSGGAGDVAVRYSGDHGGTKVAAGVAYANQSSISSSVDTTVNGSLSVLLENGLNLTAAAGMQEASASGRDDPMFYYGKLGYRADVFPVGITALSVDLGQFDDVSANGDEALAAGLQLVQNLDDFGTDLYLGYRFYRLDRSATSLEDINAVLTGARVKF